MGRDGGRAHDDVSVYGRGRRGEHCGGPAGHGGEEERGEREREGWPRVAIEDCVMTSKVIRSGSSPGPPDSLPPPLWPGHISFSYLLCQPDVHHRSSP
jgi:hypothetical protein